jgi:hypothetical protein
VNELQEFEALFQELLSVIQSVMESGEVLSDEIQGELARTLELLSGRIEQLRNQSAPPIPPQGPDLTQAMPSSNIEGFAYDKDNGRLLVRFLGKHPNRNGPIYGYEGVPANIFEIFRKGAIPAKTNGKNKWGEWWQGKYPSIGAAMYHVIRAGGYQYQRLT